MHPTLRLVIRISLLALGFLLLADLLRAQGVPTARARITYLTASSAYIDAGQAEGIIEGTRLEVLHGDTVVAVLLAAYVSPHRASCTIVNRTTDLVVGDSVRFTPAATPAPVADTIGQSQPRADSTYATAGPPDRQTAPLHGRLGIRYLTVRQGGGGPSYSQPSLDLRLEGSNLGGSGFGLSADVRARRTSSTLADGGTTNDHSYRVYGLALAYNQPGTPLRVTVGRQFSAPLANVSFFDGVTAEYTRPTWGFGAFGGSQPDPTTFGYSTDLKELGAFVQLRSRPGTAGRWSFTTGAIGSYQQGEVNREFLFLNGSWNSPRLSAFVSQEVDYNRGWKITAGEPTLAPTSTYANLSFRPSGALSLRAGFDNRRNVRLYRDFVNPETQFDDAFRQGLWGGISLSARGGYHLGLDVRTSTGGSAGNANSYTLSLGADRFVGSPLSLRTRSTHYRSDVSSGWLYSVTLGVYPGGPFHLELNAGLRRNTNPLDSPVATSVHWFGLDLDLNLSRAWYLLLSASRESGGADNNTQLYGGGSYRF